MNKSSSPAGLRRFRLPSVDGTELECAEHSPTDVRPQGTVIQAHGITANLDEGGMFVRLAERLSAAGFRVIRFSFRGHGSSGGTQEGMTIAGEMLDLQAVLDYATRSGDGRPISIVAASFGAVSTCLSLPFIDSKVRGLCLWNPVLDLVRTFVAPELPWQRKNFGAASQAQLHDPGFLLIDGGFRMGRVLFEECKQLRPLEHFLASPVPSLIVHGDRDESVSYDIARRAAADRAHCDFETIAGSDHGFDGADKERAAIDHTVRWLAARD